MIPELVFTISGIPSVSMYLTDYIQGRLCEKW